MYGNKKSHGRTDPCRGFIFKNLVILDAVLLIEALDTTTSRSGSLLTGVERMALGACFNMDLRLGRTGYESVTAVAGNLALIVLRLNLFIHCNHLFLF